MTHRSSSSTRSRAPFVAFAVVAIALGAIARHSIAATDVEPTEEEPVVDAASLVQPSLLSGPGFTVDPHVELRGYMAHFTLDTKAGPLNADSIELLAERVDPDRRAACGLALAKLDLLMQNGGRGRCSFYGPLG